MEKPFKRYSVNVAFSMSEINKYIALNYDLETDDLLPISRVLHDKKIDFDMSEFDSGSKEYERFHLDIVVDAIYKFLIEEFFQVSKSDVYLIYDITNLTSFFIGYNQTRNMFIDIAFKTKNSLNQFKICNPDMYNEIVKMNNRMTRICN